MEHILEPNSSFDFSQISCISPSSISGGNYFIRTLTKKQEPLYIQSPKCFTKQGIVKSGKKMYCDLLLKHEDESFLEFLESLESFCHKQIFENRERWFDSGLTIVDIENCFVCPTKSFKSGKIHVLRTHVPVRLGKCDIRIFNEQEQDVPLESVNETTNVITILEIQGIRCLARNFQIDLEIKQMMILKPKDIFERCLFGKTATNKEKEEPEEKDEPVKEEKYKRDEEEEKYKREEKDEDKPVEEEKEEPVEGKNYKPEEKYEEDEPEENYKPEEKDPDELVVKSDNNGLCEVTLELSDSEINQSEIKLKKPNEVYYEMYKKAKKKAQIARDIAIASYLSANQIKHNYLKGEDISDDEEMRTQEKELREL
jgi:hypothetical protein